MAKKVENANTDGNGPMRKPGFPEIRKVAKELGIKASGKAEEQLLDACHEEIIKRYDAEKLGDSHTLVTFYNETITPEEEKKEKPAKETGAQDKRVATEEEKKVEEDAKDLEKARKKKEKIEEKARKKKEEADADAKKKVDAAKKKGKGEAKTMKKKGAGKKDKYGFREGSKCAMIMVLAAAGKHTVKEIQEELKGKTNLHPKAVFKALVQRGAFQANIKKDGKIKIVKSKG